MTRQRTNPDRILTNAERCKRYRNKNVDVYRKEDAKNKRYKRILASEDPFANKKRLEEQAEKKRLYRLRKKLTANGANQGHQLHQATSSTPELELSQPSNAASSTPASSTPTLLTPAATPGETTASSTPTSKPSSSFKHKSTRARSLKRAENALPKSPSKRQEVVQKLVQDVLKVKIPFVSNKKKRPSSKRFYSRGRGVAGRVFPTTGDYQTFPSTKRQCLCG